MIQLVDIAPEFRMYNQGGSCVHVTTVMLLRWLGLYDIGEKWRRSYRGGESPGPHRKKLEAMGLKYAMTTDTDLSLIEYGIQSRRGAGVTWGGAHCVALVGKIDEQAVLLDNNSPKNFKFRPWNTFIREFDRCGGWAFVILSGRVPPPVPIGRGRYV